MKNRGLIVLFLLILIICSSCERVDPYKHVDLLQDDDPLIRMSAAQKLGDIGGEIAVSALIEALDDVDPRVQRSVIAALTEIGPEACLGLITEVKTKNISTPILDFDDSTEAYIEPSSQPLANLGTDKAIICFFPEIVNGLAKSNDAELVHSLYGEASTRNIYLLDRNGEKIVVMHPGVGAPLAVASVERLIASGVKKIVGVGGAGVLHRRVEFGEFMVPLEAIRDEGTSYHYLAPGEAARPSAYVIDILKSVLEQNNLTYEVGKTWTTDAIYRETKKKVDLRRGQGCLMVEMEASALFALAEFRGIDLGMILYGADSLVGDEWDERSWRDVPELRRQLFDLAVEAVLEMD